MNKSHNKRMIFQHLNDANTNQKPDEKCGNCVMKKIGELANKYEPLLTKRRSYILETFLFQQVIFMDYRRFINLNK